MNASRHCFLTDTFFKRSDKLSTLDTGPIFIPPPTPENSLMGVEGRIKEGGGYKFLPRGASKYTPPTPSLKNALWAKMRERGSGGIKFLLGLDVLKPGSRFATIQSATGSQ